MINKNNKGISAPLAGKCTKKQNVTVSVLRLLMVGASVTLLSACVSSGGGGGGGEGDGKSSTFAPYKYLTNPNTGYKRPSYYNYEGSSAAEKKTTHTGLIGMNDDNVKRLSGKNHKTGEKYKLGVMEGRGGGASGSYDVYKNDDYTKFSPGRKFDAAFGVMKDNYVGEDATSALADNPSHIHEVAAYMRQTAQEADIVPIVIETPYNTKKVFLDYAKTKNLLAVNYSMGMGHVYAINICKTSACTSHIKYGHHSLIGADGINYDNKPLTPADITALRDNFKIGGKSWVEYYYGNGALKGYLKDKDGNDLVGKINSTTYNEWHDYPILVQAAGNEKVKNNIDFSLAYYVAKLEKLALTVVSFDHASGTRGNLSKAGWSRGSNACGILRSMCLGAPGNGAPYKVNFKHTDTTKNKGEENRNNSGTSFSAPIVTGAFALLKQRFPPLSNREIRERLLKTASHTLADGSKLRDNDGNLLKKRNDDGTATGDAFDYNDPNAVSHEFGRGALRVDKAVNPVGVPKYILRGKNLKDEGTFASDDYRLYTSSAFGGGVSSALSDHKVTVFDDLDAPFITSLSGIAHQGYVPHTPNVYIQKRNGFKYQYTTLDNRVSFVPRGVSHTQAIKSGFYAVPQNQVDLLGEHLNYSGESKGVKTTLSASLNKRNFAYKTAKKITVGSINVTPQHQVLWETGALLGTSGKGYAQFKGHSVNNFLSLDINTTLGNTQYGLQATKGYTQVHGLKDSMVKLPKHIQTQSMNAYALHTDKEDKNTGFGVMMPLRVTHAKAKLNYVTARDKRKNLTYNQTTVSLAPKGQQVNYELFHSLPYEQGTLRFGGLYMQDKDHKQNNNQWQMGVSMKWQF